MKKLVSVVCLLFVAVAMMAATSHVKHVTAIGEVLGDGAKTHRRGHRVRRSHPQQQPFHSILHR